MSSSSGSDLEILEKQNITRSSKGQPMGHHVTFSLEDYQIEGQKLIQPDTEILDAVQSEPNETPSSKLTRRQLLIILVYAFTEFSSGAVISLQAPFYPAEAEKKGLTASEYGLVFGIFEFTVFAVSLLYGKYMFTVGPKFTYNLGLFDQGVCCILFGTLDRIGGRGTFFALSMLTRIMAALGSGACVNGSFTIIALEFPQSVATTFATMEMLFALGLTSGPIIGGALYEVGGYPLPFAVVGTFLVLTSIFTFFALPTPVDLNEESKSSKGLLDMLRIPEVGVASLVIFSAALSMGHLASTLEPHIRVFELSSVSVGLVMVISGATYAILSPIWGRFCDRKPILNVYMFIGSVFIIIGFLLVGPAPFLPFNTTLWVTCIGLVCHGIGIGGSLVTCFIQCLTSANAHGFPDNAATYSLVSGIWASFFSLGTFIGPTLSGILYDTVGFRNGTLFVVGLETIVLIALMCLMCFGKIPQPGSGRRLSDFTESEPLIRKTTKNS